MYELEHSSKGSTWKNHKYTGIKIIDGKKRYIYGASQLAEAADKTRAIGKFAAKSTARHIKERESEKNKRGPKNTPATRTMDKAVMTARVKTAVNKVKDKSINSSITDKVAKALSSAVKRTRTSPDRVTETKSGSKITNYGVYSNYEKKKRYE